MRKLLAAFAVLILVAPALARENGAWEETPPAVRHWFQNLMQPDHAGVSCCGEADAYYADEFEVEGDHYVAIITDVRDVPGRPEIAPGTRVPVPNNKLKIDQGNPTGHGIIFIGTQGQVYCYVTPAGI